MEGVASKVILIDDGPDLGGEFEEMAGLVHVGGAVTSRGDSGVVILIYISPG